MVFNESHIELFMFWTQTYMDSESFVTGGPTWMIFLVDEGREDKQAIIGSPAKHH